MLNIILLAIQVLSALTLIFLILLHSGRGGGLSDMFGGGQLGGSMAGSTVVERNLDRLTVITGVIFMFTTVLFALRVDCTALLPVGSPTSSQAGGARAVLVTNGVESSARPSTSRGAPAVTIGGGAGSHRCRRQLVASPTARLPRSS